MRPLRLAKDRRNVNEKYARSTGTINPKLPKLPLAFIGLAAYRAWIELTFVGSYFREAPYSPMARDAFDLSMMAFLVLGVLFAKTAYTAHREAIYSQHSASHAADLNGVRRRRSVLRRMGRSFIIGGSNYRRGRNRYHAHSLVGAL